MTAFQMLFALIVIALLPAILAVFARIMHLLIGKKTFFDLNLVMIIRQTVLFLVGLIFIAILLAILSTGPIAGYKAYKSFTEDSWNSATQSMLGLSLILGYALVVTATAIAFIGCIFQEIRRCYYLRSLDEYPLILTTTVTSVDTKIHRGPRRRYRSFTIRCDHSDMLIDERIFFVLENLSPDKYDINRFLGAKLTVIMHRQYPKAYRFDMAEIDDLARIFLA